MSISHEARRQRRQAIIDRLRAGESIQRLAAEYECTENHVRNIAVIGSVRAIGSKSIRLAKRRAQLIEFHSLGQTQAAFVRLTGTSRVTVSLWTRTSGLKFRKDTAGWTGTITASKKRAATMAALYREGYTLEQIGQQFGITRERVRQLMTKHLGIRQNDGGAHTKRVRARAAMNAERDGQCLAKLGCTRQQYKEVLALGRRVMAAGGSRERTPMGAFIAQKRNARNRDIGWELTFWQWWTIWQQSGHWEQRGRGQGYVMRRHGDEGPYAAGNVFIATAIQNTSDGNRKVNDLPIGVKRTKAGTFLACRTINGQRLRLGTHPTPELAHAAYLMAAPQHAQAA